MGQTIFDFSNIVVYHHYDADGYASAAIIKQFMNKAYKDAGKELPEIIYSSCRHNKPMDFSLVNKMMPNLIFIVDYSFNRDDDQLELVKLVSEGGHAIIWIDHHLSSKQIECAVVHNTHPEYETVEEGKLFKDLPGLRLLDKDSPYAGCILTYVYMETLKDNGYKITKLDNIDSPYYELAPRWLKLISDHDTWQPNEDGHDFCGAIDLLGNINVLLQKSDDSEYAFPPFSEMTDEKEIIEVTNHLLEKGREIKEIDTIRNKRIVESSAWESEIDIVLDVDLIDPDGSLLLETETGVDGKKYIRRHIRILSLNKGGNSLVFGKKYYDYDAVCLTRFDGTNFVTSMFSAVKDVTWDSDGGFECVIIAIFFNKYYGITGGGHRHAAGWTSPIIDFKKDRRYLITNDSNGGLIFEEC